jgi:hypothetical protein
MWLVMIFSLAFASSSLWGKSWGLHACGATSLHIVSPPNSSLTPLFSETRLKRKDFQEVARLGWAHAARLQQLHPSLLTANVSNKSGNLKDKPAAECLRCRVEQGTRYALVAGKNVYTLEGHEVELDKYAAQKVTAKGTLKGETLTVESVHPAK